MYRPPKSFAGKVDTETVEPSGSQPRARTVKRAEIIESVDREPELIRCFVKNCNHEGIILILFNDRKSGTLVKARVCKECFELYKKNMMI